MPKNVFVYPCDSFVGRAVAKAFSAAGHAVSGHAIEGGDVPPSAHTVVRATDSDAAVAHKQLLLTADVVVYDLLGNERATRDAVVQLAQQPYGGREVLFVAVSSPLVWAATRPSPSELFAAAAGASAGSAATSGIVGAAGGGAGGEWADGDGALGFGGDGTGGGDGEEAPWPGSGAGTGSGDGEELADSMAGSGALGPAGNSGSSGGAGLGAAATVSGVDMATLEEALGRPGSPAVVAPTFRAPEDVPRRLAAAPARAALAVEQLVLRAGRRGRLRTAVVCPGLLYGEGEDDLVFCNAFKAAWTWQCRPARASPAGVLPSPPPRLLVYGKGNNVLPTLHVADLASYVLALAGGPATAPAAAAATGTQPSAATATGALTSATAAATAMSAAVGGSSLLSSFSNGGVVGGGGSNGGTYLLVTDGSRCTQLELVTAIAAALGLGPEEAAIEHIPESELHLQPPALRSRMLLDLSLATSPLPPFTASPFSATAATAAAGTGALSAPPFFTLSRPGGLPAHLADVAAEFKAARRLTPLRLLVTGPPLSGKTHLARRLAHRYGLVYISVPLLLAAAADPAAAAAAGLSSGTDPALLRAAQAEISLGPTAFPNPKEKEKDREGPPPGWLPTGGRVSAKTLGALLAAALADPRVAANCRGFVLDGFPRSAAQARAAFYTLAVDEVAAAALAAAAAEQSHGKLGGHRGHKGSDPHRGVSLVTTPSTPNLAAAGLSPAVGPGGSADIFELPPATKLVPNPLTAPTHVIELEVGEEELRARLAAVAAAADEAVTRLTGETAQSDADKKAAPKRPPGTSGGAGGGPGGKAGAGVVPREVYLAAALGHNAEAGFNRRLTAYGNWRADDAADLRSRVAAVQAAWEADCSRLEVERSRLEAEASTLKAKRRRARAAAAAAAAGGGAGRGANFAANADDEDEVAVGNALDVDVQQQQPGVPSAPPELPQHGGLMALSLGAGGATHIRLANPTLPEGPHVTCPVQPPAAAAILANGPAAATSGLAGPTSIAMTVAAAAQQVLAAAAPAAPPPALPALERSVEALLGPPHNLAGFPEGPAVAAAPSAATVEAGAEPAAAAAPPPPAAAMAIAVPAALVAPAKMPGSETVPMTMTPSTTGAPATPPPAPAPSVAVAVPALVNPLAAAVEAGAEASYANRWRGSRGAAVRRYLLRHVVPVITEALAEVAVARTGSTATRPSTAATISSTSGGAGTFDAAAAAASAAAGGAASPPGHVARPGSGAATPPPPIAQAPWSPAPSTSLGPGSSGKEALLHVSRALAAAAEAAEAAFVDPYSDPAYGIQLAKIDAKKAREAARAAVAAAKAEREAAARHSQQQLLQAAKEEEEEQQ